MRGNSFPWFLPQKENFNHWYKHFVSLPLFLLLFFFHLFVCMYVNQDALECYKRMLIYFHWALWFKFMYVFIFYHLHVSFCNKTYSLPCMVRQCQIHWFFICLSCFTVTNFAFVCSVSVILISWFECTCFLSWMCVYNLCLWHCQPMSSCPQHDKSSTCMPPCSGHH